MAAVIGRWHGKPVRSRRGPATVTGEVRRTRPPGAGHWLASASREGAAGSARKPGDLRRPHAHIDPRGKGLATHASHPIRVALGARASRPPAPRRRPGAAASRRRDRGGTAARRARRRASPSASRGRSSTLVPATAVTLERRHGRQGRRRRRRLRGLSAAGALELATQRRLERNLVGVATARTSSTRSTASRSPAPARATGRSGSTTRPPPQGICGVDPKPGDSASCSSPTATARRARKSAGVLGVRRPGRRRAGRPFTVTVTAYDDANGERSPARPARPSAAAARARRPAPAGPRR